MDGPPIVVPFIIASLLRLGVPLLLTYGAAWLLRRLDARWQSEADAWSSTARSSVIDDVPALRCWRLRDCPDDARAYCPAYRDRSTPCWQHFRDERGRMATRCLSCQVFRRWLVPEPA